jgi:hypothetical protein
MLIVLSLVACEPTAEAEAVGFEPNGCGVAAAYQDGRRWSWASVEGAAAFAEWTSEVRGLTDVTARVWTEGSRAEAKISEDYSRMSELECGGGAWLVREESQSAGLDGGVAFSAHAIVEYDEPVLLFPEDMKAGDTWTSRYVGTSTSDRVGTPVSRTVDHLVKAPAEIEVEGGTFRAFQVLATDDTGAEWRFWVSREVGVVKGPDYELIGIW